MFRLSVLAAALALTTSVFAEPSYYVVVPMPGKVASAPAAPQVPITITLNAYTLPVGAVGADYDFNLNTVLQVTGDSAFNPAQVGWSIESGALPQGIALEADGRLAGVPVAPTAGVGASFDVRASYRGASGKQTYNLVVSGVVASCLDLLQTQPDTVSGWYNLTVNGVTTPYYCDMDSDGGGWTRIVRQTEANPVTNWNGGVNGSSYALATARIPTHTQTGFGRDELATDVDFVDFVYTTGDIPTTLVASKRFSGVHYHIHRSTVSSFNGLDPESPVYLVGLNALTFDRTGGMHFTWGFIATGTGAWAGYAYKGDLQGSHESFAWTVWVR